MPATTTGAAYSTKRHIETVRENYGFAAQQLYKEVLTNLADLRLNQIGGSRRTKLEKKPN